MPVLVLGLGCGTVSEPGTSPPDPGVATGGPVREIDRVLETLLAPPMVQTAPGFSATVLVPPGELYDPLTMISRGDVVWVNDDGGTGPHGRIWEIDREGHVSVAVEAERMNASTGFDVAPPGFGDHGGRIFTLSQQEFYGPGVRRNHVIEVVDPEGTAHAETFCELPTHGSVGDGIAGAGLEARFGPPDTPFANRFFSVTILNNTVYQTTADRTCTPFATFDRQVWGIAFTSDGSRMLATLKGGGPLMSGAAASAADANQGAIVAVNPDGVIDPVPVLSTPRRPTDVEVAPDDFGEYAGQIFYTDWESDSSAPLDARLSGESTLYRIDADGDPHLVASGFVRPAGILFVDGSIWVSNINRDRVDMPEGSIIRLNVD